MPTPRRLPSGARFGPYEIERSIGQGGMGAVYAAHDSRLNRKVAIKVLHDDGGEAQARLMREGQAAAALQHPHICGLFDVGVHDGVGYLVLEYLDGERLRGPMPLRRVAELGAQVADALDAAHRRQIAHRDLKPSNVLLTKSGVKVLDFGVARLHDDVTLTAAGSVVGTPAYMAPEQLAGQPGDSRTDIHALGRLLIEIATGRNDPTKRTGQAAFDAILDGCLAEAPEERWQSARDVGRMLRSLDTSVPSPAAAQGGARRRLAMVAGAAAVATAAVAVILIRPWRPVDTAPAFHLSVAPPPGSTFLMARNREGGVAVSPDGTHLAFVARTGAQAQLWLQPLAAGEARPLAGTDDAFYPFWSPDSRQIAFYTPDSVKIVSIEGGSVRRVARTDPRAMGGAWPEPDTLLITGVGLEIRRISPRGGEPHILVEGEAPSPIAGTRAFLFSTRGRIMAASLDDPSSARPLVETPIPHAAYSQGHLLFVRNRALMAQRLDPVRLELSGDPFVVAESLLINRAGTPATHVSFSVSSGGVLAYAAGDPLSYLRWRDRTGRILGTLGDLGDYQTARISPDGTRVVFARVDGDNMDIWIADERRGPATRFTFDTAAEQFPIWSPDGRAITYAAGANDAFDLFRKAADGSGPVEPLTRDPGPQHPMDWSADGRYLAFTRNSNRIGTDLRILPEPGHEPYDFLATIVSEAHTQFAPGRPPRWVAYSSDETGRREIYVRAFTPGAPAAPTRWQVSVEGGTMPRWRGDGRELFYWAPDGRIMAVAVDGEGTAFRSAPPVTLFAVQRPTLRTNALEYDVTRDGQRFLITEPSERASFQTLSLVTNWLPPR